MVRVSWKKEKWLPQKRSVFPVPGGTQAEAVQPPGEDVVKRMEKLDLVVFQVWESESHQKGKCLFLPALHPHPPHYFSGKYQEAWEFYLQIQPLHFSLFDLRTRFQTSLVVQWLRLCTSIAEGTVQSLGGKGKVLHVCSLTKKEKTDFFEIQKTEF